MITYTKAEIKRAILKTFPVGSSFYRNEWENVKWHLILNDGFEKRGFLNEDVFFRAIGEMRDGNYFERHRDPVTKERFYIRIR
jgi:hypothetical protein